MKLVLIAALSVALSAEVNAERRSLLSQRNKVRSQDDKEFCWRKSYGRGVGKVPSQCADGQEMIGLLCYTKCSEFDSGGFTYKRFGFDCHQECSAKALGSGWEDQGLYCRHLEYGRGAGRSPCTGCSGCSWGGCSGCSDCSTSHCTSSEEPNGLLCYPKCSSGYSSFGCCICRPAVPDCNAIGMDAGLDLSCAKKIHIGEALTGVCGDDEEKSIALCYPKCEASYVGVGPVCWGAAPTVGGVEYTECGMGAAISTEKCATVIGDQVWQPLKWVFDKIESASSKKASKSSKKTSKTAKEATETAKSTEEAVEETAKSAKETSTLLAKMAKVAKSVGKVAKNVSTLVTLSGAFVDSVNNGTQSEQIESALTVASTLASAVGGDAVVDAYNYPHCDDLQDDASVETDASDSSTTSTATTSAPTESS